MQLPLSGDQRFKSKDFHLDCGLHASRATSDGGDRFVNCLVATSTVPYLAVLEFLALRTSGWQPFVRQNMPALLIFEFAFASAQVELERVAQWWQEQAHIYDTLILAHS